MGTGRKRFKKDYEVGVKGIREAYEESMGTGYKVLFLSHENYALKSITDIHYNQCGDNMINAISEGGFSGNNLTLELFFTKTDHITAMIKEARGDGVDIIQKDVEIKQMIEKVHGVERSK